MAKVMMFLVICLGSLAGCSGAIPTMIGIAANADATECNKRCAGQSNKTECVDKCIEKLRGQKSSGETKVEDPIPGHKWQPPDLSPRLK